MKRMSQFAIFVQTTATEVSAEARPGTINVSRLGQAGWDSGDTRAQGYTDVNGANQLRRGRASEDMLIDERLSFVRGPRRAPRGAGSVAFYTAAPGDKATLEYRRFRESLINGPAASRPRRAYCQIQRAPAATPTRTPAYLQR